LHPRHIGAARTERVRQTTTLRCIAGLEEPTIGNINIHGTVVFSDQKTLNLPPNDAISAWCSSPMRSASS